MLFRSSKQHALKDWPQIAAGHSGSVLLHTARTDAENQASFLFTDPLEILSTNRLDAIPAIFASIDRALQAGHYVAGFLSYEAGYHFEPAAMRSVSPLAESDPPLADLPLLWFGIYRQPLISNEPEPMETNPESDLPNPEALSIAISSAGYHAQIQQIRRYIEAGDIYQANFTVPVHQAWPHGAAQLFEKIMENQPVPYGAMINTGHAHILSASPELFFRKQGSQMTVRPMKGTANRGRDLEEDRQAAAWLSADEKNRAENVMIVDLLRNDLGRICQPGSIVVSDLFAVERYPDLLQMTSTVRGQLQRETSHYEIFRALFPCGSITGAPKVRTMQIIRELEQAPRGVACGAIGYFSPTGEAVFSVAIRTVTLRNAEAHLRIGSGITHDSDPEAEYAECLLKSRFLTRTSSRFELIETLAWEGGFEFLDLHLQRLQSSAEYFGFHCAPERIRHELDRFAADLPKESRHRVRLLLSRYGAVSIASSPLTPSRHPAALLIAPERTDSTDPFLRHKTTRRSLYDRALKDAQAAGYDDAIFLNELGQVTECAIHNIMIAKGEKLITPPLTCGLLPGIYRRHLLATHPEIQQTVLTLEDVLSADRVFIFNSVRGLRQAQIATGQNSLQKVGTK